MKIPLKQFENRISDVISNRIKATLVYGPDRGMVSSVANRIISQGSYEVKNVTYNEINDYGIKNFLHSQNLFSSKEIIKVSNCTSSISSELKSALIEDYCNIVIFIAEELPPSSTLRKFFETESNLACVACYPEEDLALRQLIIQMISNAGKSINKEAIEYIMVNVTGDRYIVKKEINKLLLYIGSKASITFEDTEAVISPSFDTSADLLCYCFANQDAKGYFKELTKLYNDNISPIWIIRALIRFYTNLYIVKLALNENTHIDTALKLAKPPIFFKYIANFKKLLLNLDIGVLYNVLAQLHKAESQAKKTGSYPENICEELFFSLTI